MPSEVETDATEAAPQEKDVDFVSKSEYTKVHKEAESLAALVDKLNQERESYKSQLESFGDFTPDEAKALRKQLQELKAEQAGGDKEALNAIWEEKESELRTEFGKLHEKDQSTIQKLSSELHELKVTSKVMDEFGGQVNDDMRSFVKEVVAKSVDIDEHTGRFVVKDDKGELRYNPTDPSKRMSVEEFFQELEARYPSAFKAKGINKGSIQNGQQVQGTTTSTLGNIDIERCKTDKGYLQAVLEKAPRSVRTKLYEELGI